MIRYSNETELKESTIGWIAIFSYAALCLLLYSVT
jgi:hypothetical protein